MKHKIFKAIAKLYPYMNSDRISGKIDKLTLLCTLLFALLQKIKLLWRGDFSITYWKYYEKYWEYLAYFCPVQLSAKLDVLYNFYIFCMAFQAFTIFLLLIFFFEIFKKKSKNQLFERLLRGIIKLQTGLFYVPSLFSYSLVLKYSISQKNEIIKDCIGTIFSQSLSLGSTGFILSLTCILSIIPLACFKEAFAYEVRHNYVIHNINAKNTPLLELQSKIITAGTVIFYVFSSEGNYIFYIAFVGICQAYIAGSYIWYLPFYSDFANFSYACYELELAFFVGFFAIGIGLNTATVVIVLGIVMQPLIVLVVIGSIEYRKNKILSGKNNWESVRIFELSIRKKLLNNKPSAKVIRLIKKYYKKTDEKLVLVFLAEHCITKFGQMKNALIQISRASYKNRGLITNFQIYKYQKALEKENYLSSEGMKFKIFIKYFEGIKNAELKLFDSIVSFSDSILNSQSSLESLKKTFSSTHFLVRSIRKLYRKALVKFPESELFNEMYGSLLIMLGKIEKGKKYLSQSILFHELNRKKHKVDMLFTDKDSFIMIISGNTYDFGKCRYISPSLCRVLSVIPEESTFYYINDFVPKFFHHNHYKSMENFLINFAEEQLFKNVPLHLSDTFGFLIECRLTMDCYGYDSSVEYIVEINSAQNSGRECAIIKSNGEIIAHSQRLSELLETDDLRIEGKNITQYISGAGIEKIMKGDPVFVETRENSRKLCLFLQEKRISTTIIYVIFVISDDSIIIALSLEKTVIEQKKKLNILLKLEPSETIESSSQRLKSSKIFKKSRILNNTFNLDSDCNILGNALKIVNFKKTGQILRAFRNLQIFIILSFLAVVVSNIIILVSVSNQLQHSIQLEALGVLGRANSYIACLTYISRTLYLTRYFNGTEIFTPSDLNYYSQKLKDLHSIFLNKEEDWSYWPHSKIITNPVLPVYMNYSSPELSYINLLDMISNTWDNTQEFLRTYSQKPLFYLMYNTFRISLSHLQIAFDDLVYSERLILKNLNSMFISLFIAGICIIGIFESLAIIMNWHLHKNLKQTWDSLQTKISDNYFNIKKSLNTRVSKYYNLDDNLYPFEDYSAQKKLSFPHFWHYLLRLCLIVVLGLLVYFISFFVFFANTQYFMMGKVDFADAMLNRRVFVYQRNLFLIEFYADYKKVGFIDSYGFSPLFPPKIGYKFMADNMIILRRKAFKRSMQMVIRPEVWNEIYNKIEGETGFLRNGLSDAVIEIKWECLFLSTNFKNCNFGCYDRINNEIKALMSYYDRTADSTDLSSTFSLRNSYESLMYFNIFGMVLLFGIVAFYILPYFYREMNIVKFMQIKRKEPCSLSEENKKRDMSYVELMSKYKEQNSTKLIKN